MPVIVACEDGGYVVSSFFAVELNDKSLESEVVRPRARIINAMSNGQNIGYRDAFDDTSDIANLKGGWVAEGASGSYEKACIQAADTAFHETDADI